jgi:hypothetical protein
MAPYGYFAERGSQPIFKFLRRPAPSPDKHAKKIPASESPEDVAGVIERCPGEQSIRILEEGDHMLLALVSVTLWIMFRGCEIGCDHACALQ